MTSLVLYDDGARKVPKKCYTLFEWSLNTKQWGQNFLRKICKIFFAFRCFYEASNHNFHVC